MPLSKRVLLLVTKCTFKAVEKRILLPFRWIMNLANHPSLSVNQIKSIENFTRSETDDCILSLAKTEFRMMCSKPAKPSKLLMDDGRKPTDAWPSYSHKLFGSTFVN